MEIQYLTLFKIYRIAGIDSILFELQNLFLEDTYLVHLRNLLFQPKQRALAS